MELKSGVYGRYRLTVRRDDEVIEQTPWFDNLIVNNGLDLLGTNTFNQSIIYAYVGTSSTAPDNTDTALGAQIAATNSNGLGGSNTSNNTGSPYYFGYKYVKRFAKGDAAGNLAEVGVGRNSAGDNLFSRALILDGAGNPTTLTITSIDVLDVEYEFRVYVEEGDVAWSETVNGTSYSGIIRPSNIGRIDDLTYVYREYSSNLGAFWSNGAIGGITGVLGGDTEATEDSDIEPSTYTAGNYYRDVVFSADTDDINLSGGVSAMATTEGFIYGWDDGPVFQMSFSPPIPKDNTKTFEFVLRFTWARYTP